MKKTAHRLLRQAATTDTFGLWNSAAGDPAIGNPMIGNVGSSVMYVPAVAGAQTFAANALVKR